MLRDYQQDAVKALRRSVGMGAKHPVLQLPTGGGKTHIAVDIIRSALEKGKRVLFLAPRRELIYQAAERLRDHGIDPGIIMAGEPRNEFAMVQVASFDTLHSRGIRRETMLMPLADVVIVDEAHLSIAKTKQDIIRYYENSIVIGLTATPARGDGRGLGEIYDDLVLSWPMRKLVEAGYLVKARYFAGETPDLSGIGLNAQGDYIESQLAQRVDKPKLVGDVVTNWMRIAGGKRTAIFAVNVAHSQHLCDELRRYGVSAEHLDGKTPLNERKAILARIDSGETQVLCNVYVATYGLDIPGLECAVLARPTRNISLYLQTCGRVLRPAEGKTEAIVIDHAGAVHMHGFLDDFVPWSLEANGKVAERKRSEAEKRKEPKQITCSACQTVFKGSRTCPECGHQMIPPGKPIPVHEAELQEISPTKANRITSPEEKARFFAELKGYAFENHYSSGWASHKYRTKFGVWPNAHKDVKMIAPSQETKNWCKAQQIAFAKTKKHTQPYNGVA